MTMPPFSEKKLEEKLATAGKSLFQLLPSLDEILLLLYLIEALLSKVEQSPAKSIQNALSPLMKALAVDYLMKHFNVDVRVGVASCISEITRISAPDLPYCEDKMKDVLQLLVSSFQNLSDITSRSYERIASILEAMAKLRSCVIMLNLECDQMIIEMFQHFLNAIRGDHADIIFTYMETIMTTVLEESDDIYPELLAPILATLKKNNEPAMPIAKKLAERVLQNSVDKLRPYLRRAVKSLDTSLDDYSEVVSFVCGGNTDAVGQSNDQPDETPNTSNRRKRTRGKEKATETLEYGENLVGAKVKVWWPIDRRFYEGEIASFDSAKKKHKVAYADGDEEVLNLKKERWEFIEGDKVSDGDQEVGQSSRDPSSDMRRKKKGRDTKN